MPFLTNETKAGTPIQAGDTTLVPFANSIVVRVPFIPGGLIWNRPVAVAVQTAHGQEYILPIQDMTRQIFFALLGATLVSSLVIFSFSRKFEKKSK